MEISKKPWPILSICGFKGASTPILIFSVRPFGASAKSSCSSIPSCAATIFRSSTGAKVSKTPEKYEVVDGQQRLRAIFEFHAGDFTLPKDADDIDGIVVTKMKYADLPEDLRLRFDNYALDVIVLSDTSEDEVREMFLRLQNGTTLKAQEKRNAMPGKMRSFVRDLSQHPFFSRCAFSNARFTHDLVAAQMTAIEQNGGPCHVRNANLNAMYDAHQDFDSTGPKARKIRRVLEYLAQAFTEKTPELERFSVISLYALVSHCLESYVMQGRQDADCANGSSPSSRTAPPRTDCRPINVTPRCSHTKNERATARMRKIRFNGATSTCCESSLRRSRTSSKRTVSDCFLTLSALPSSVEMVASARFGSSARAPSANGTRGKLTTRRHGPLAARRRSRTDKWRAQLAIRPKGIPSRFPARTTLTRDQTARTRSRNNG